jgi:hypothetical protein
MNPTERRRISEHFKASYGIDVSHKDFDSNYEYTLVDGSTKVRKEGR